jgi:LysM repeat protein
MDTKRFFRYVVFLVMVIALVFGLSSCNLSASKGPAAIASPESGENMPLPGDERSGGQETNFEEAVKATELAETLTQPEAVAPAVTETPVPEAAPKPTSAVEVVVQPLPTEGKPPATYTLQKGEFPWCIARRYNVNPVELLSLNGLNINSQVYVGAVLKIPQTGNSFGAERSLKTHPVDYTVRAGDTIYTVACAFGDVSPDAIIAANGLTSPYALTSGSVIRIP